jgi:hypothetical protein
MFFAVRVSLLLVAVLIGGCAVNGVDTAGTADVTVTAGGAGGSCASSGERQIVPARAALHPTDQPGSPLVGAPTAGDASAVVELYQQRARGWAPWQPIARSPTPTAPFDYQLAPGVDPVGGPAVAAADDPEVEIFARASDGAVYGTRNLLADGKFVGWADWSALSQNLDLDSDPAVAVLDPETLHLAAHSARYRIVVMRTRAEGTWSAWISLGAPAVGAVSAPAVAALDGRQLTVIVRASDGLLYQQTCRDPHDDCIANVGGFDVDGVDLWTPLDPPPAAWSFVGKPNAVWTHDEDGDKLVVTAVGTDGKAHWLVRGPRETDTSGWRELRFPRFGADDPEPAVVALSTTGSFEDLAFLARGSRGLLIRVSPDGTLDRLGGLLASPPGAASAGARVVVVGLMNDHGRPGVWWRFAGGFTPPCTTAVTAL